MSIETEHNGHRITYAENEDVWRCWALDLDAKTLSALKTKINKVDADARRVSNFRAWLVRGYSAEAKLVEIVLVDGDFAWTLCKSPGFVRGAQAQMRREKHKLSDLAPDTADVREFIDRWKEAHAAVNRANERVREAERAIPRLTAAMLQNMPSEAA